MLRPVIGVMPLVDEERESYWILPGYMKGIEAAGGIPVMLPLTQDKAVLRSLAEFFDGFLFTGGQDVSPELYGEKILPECGRCCPERDLMESILLDSVLAFDKPVLGICRGIQILNAAMGGTLYQDISSQRPAPFDHHMTPPYNRDVHKVTLTEDSPLYAMLGVRELGVNSYHHQAVKTVSEKLKICAVSEDGLTEGLYMPDRKFVMAVQWHPEFSYTTDENSLKIFREFVKAAVL